jgi:hypothetical protein
MADHGEAFRETPLKIRQLIDVRYGGQKILIPEQLSLEIASYLFG